MPTPIPRLRPGILLAPVVGVCLATVCSRPDGRADDASPRVRVTTANRDKGGPLSLRTYTHLSEVFPTALIRGGGVVWYRPVDRMEKVTDERCHAGPGAE